MTVYGESMATLAERAAARYGDRPAARYLRDGEWQTTTYDELWAQVRDRALGLVGLGVEPGDRVAVISQTRYEFSVIDLAINAAGAVAVPVYPTSSADETEWVVGNSGAVVAICEDADQVAKLESVRAGLPDLREILVIDPVDGRRSVAEIAAAAGDASVLDARAAAVRPGDTCLIIYTSGTTGRPKGVALTNEGFAAGRRACAALQIIRTGDVVYLYLPLAHVFAQLVMSATYGGGGTLAFWGGDATQIVPELAQVRPQFLPSVPRVFEKVYAGAMALVPPERAEEVATAIEAGVRVREAREAGGPVEPSDEEIFAKADAELFPLVRGIFGGELTGAISGAAPIAPEILRFFYAAGVPVMEGWGMTETSGIGTVNTPAAHRFGAIGRPVEAAELRVADDGELEIRGPLLLKEYWRNPQATAEAFTDDGWFRTGDVGSIDEDGYLFITGRKKDIIITAGGKNLVPANLEGDLRRSRWIAQAVMYADRKPYPVALITLDAESVVPWAQARGLPADIAELARHPDVTALIQAEVDAANAGYARVEQIKRFKILGRDFTLDAGEMTPSLKLKRNVVYANYADDFESLYAD